MIYIQNLLFFLLFIGMSGLSTAQKNKLTAEKLLQSDELFNQAVIAKMTDDEKKQQELLERFIKLRPEVAAAYYDLANIYLEKNEPVKAEQYIEKAIALDDTNVWYKVTYASALREQSRFKEAADQFLFLAEKQKNTREFYFYAANSYMLAKEYDHALKVLDKLMDVSYNDDDILLLQQDVYLKKNDFPGAVKIAEELIKRNPKDGAMVANLAKLYSSNGQDEKAKKIYEEGIQKFPNQPELQFGLATYYKSKKDTAQYDDYISKTILNADLDEAAQALMLQQYLVEIGDDSLRRSHALDIAKKLIEQQPESNLMQGFYGQILARNNQEELAAVYIKKSLATQPDQFPLWQELLFIYAGSPQYADSLIETSNQAMTYFPNNAIVHYLNAVGYSFKSDHKKAIQSINRAIDLQPEGNNALLADMYAALGDAYNGLKEYAKSDEAYDKALSLNKDNATVLNNYSYYLSLRGKRLDEAEKMSKRSLELRPGEATFLDTYGWVLYKQGKYKEAKKYIQQAIESETPADGTLFDHLGDIHYQLKEIDQAVENWKKAKEKGGVDSELLDKKIKDRKLYE